MCEVGSFCGCISLYRGCFIIGFVTIIAAAIQVLIFSLILFESYDSFSSSNAINKTVVSEDTEGSSFYSFSSPLCPFGFIPLKKRIRKENESVLELSPNLTVANNTVFPVVGVDDIGLSNESTKVLSTRVLSTTTVKFNTSITKISCLAPTQGVLMALVIASSLYAPVGIILMIGVKNGATCLLSTWFFYTVGYNLLALIVALTDGVYTGAADVSSYFVCMVTAYCIIVVDSYYEKLLRNERVESTSRARPSLVVKSTPASPGGSPEDPPLCTPPTGRHVTLPPGYATYEVNELLLPADAAYNRNVSAA